MEQVREQEDLSRFSSLSSQETDSYNGRDNNIISNNSSTLLREGQGLQDGEVRSVIRLGHISTEHRFLERGKGSARQEMRVDQLKVG